MNVACHAEKSREEHLLNIKINPIHSTQRSRIILIKQSAVTDHCLGEALNQVLDNFFERAPENAWLSTLSCLLPISKFPLNKLIPDTAYWFGCSFKRNANIELGLKDTYAFAWMSLLASKSNTLLLESVYCAFLKETLSHVHKLLNISALMQGT